MRLGSDSTDIECQPGRVAFLRSSLPQEYDHYERAFYQRSEEHQSGIGPGPSPDGGARAQGDREISAPSHSKPIHPMGGAIPAYGYVQDSRIYWSFHEGIPHI
jgi:hypothetical protein